jgi:putative SOS response-associated peptidase YedK
MSIRSYVFATALAAMSFPSASTEAATVGDLAAKSAGTFAIITTEPNELMQTIHNRMPIILSKSIESEWLNPDIEPEHAEIVTIPDKVFKR